MIGGGGVKKTLRVVAQHADIWHSFSSPEVLTEKLEVLRRHGEAVGRDVSEIEISTELRGRNEAAADELLALGTTMFTLGLSGPHHDIAAVRRWLAWRDSVNS
jgi:alkanesulfonate monooxygenase SsuD/methylene tetrahydromethanopterin reductase-like flavin-dependent oxidoreductase (luciferase family)